MIQISALCDIRNTIKDPISTISWLDPSRTCWFLMHTVWIVDVLEVSCFKFQLSVTSGTPSKTPLSTISWLDPWRTCWFLMHTVWIVDVLEVSCFKFQLSVISGTPSKTPYPPFPDWILGGHCCFIYTYELVLRATTNWLLKCSKLIHCVINTDALSCVETHD